MLADPKAPLPNRNASLQLFWDTNITGLSFHGPDIHVCARVVQEKGQKVGFSMHINSVMMGEMIMGKPFVI